MAWDTPAEAEVLVMVVVQKIAVASHPHISRNEHPDCIVDLPRIEVVIQQEQNL